MADSEAPEAQGTFVAKTRHSQESAGRARCLHRALPCRSWWSQGGSKSDPRVADTLTSTRRVPHRRRSQGVSGIGRCRLVSAGHRPSQAVFRPGDTQKARAAVGTVNTYCPRSCTLLQPPNNFEFRNNVQQLSKSDALDALIENCCPTGWGCVEERPVLDSQPRQTSDPGAAAPGSRSCRALTATATCGSRSRPCACSPAISAGTCRG